MEIRGLKWIWSNFKQQPFQLRSRKFPFVRPKFRTRTKKSTIRTKSVQKKVRGQRNVQKWDRRTKFRLDAKNFVCKTKFQSVQKWTVRTKVRTNGKSTYFAELIESCKRLFYLYFFAISFCVKQQNVPCPEN